MSLPEVPNKATYPTWFDPTFRPPRYVWGGGLPPKGGYPAVRVRKPNAQSYKGFGSLTIFVCAGMAFGYDMLIHQDRRLGMVHRIVDESRVRFLNVEHYTIAEEYLRQAIADAMIRTNMPMFFPNGLPKRYQNLDWFNTDFWQQSYLNHGVACFGVCARVDPLQYNISPLIATPLGTSYINYWEGLSRVWWVLKWLRAPLDNVEDWIKDPFAQSWWWDWAIKRHIGSLYGTRRTRRNDEALEQWKTIPRNMRADLGSQYDL
eukprot:NODE_2523_length_1045_cov_78.052288_g2505_i0.p1 GENE.NODE_2523_length_1045_cov_78.052288_g2505_i0~~NODE_2523_length_1045_cov_78.052288_g2505_i0.p1  ORF type:complete len:261 (-),score=21.18 NODE_2523_length_1045_cov_78.052288_g2505_i0:181-963(-)